MSVKLAPFQLWMLFITYSEPKTLFDKTDLLIRSCDTAIMHMEPRDANTQLMELVKMY